MNHLKDAGFNSLKKPTVLRSFAMHTVPALALICGSAHAASTADTRQAAPKAALTEAQVIRMARRFSPAAILATAREKLATASAQTAGLLPNPAVSWEREAVHSGPAEGRGSQDIFLASFPIDIARPLLRRSVKASESAWAHSEAERLRTRGVLAAVQAYYALVITKQRLDLAAQAVSNLQEAARVVELREAEGYASGYESSRLAVALELSRSRLGEIQGTYASAKTLLGTMLAQNPEHLSVAATLTFMSQSRLATIERTQGQSAPIMLHARQAIRHAEDSVDRASWAWFPVLELGGGFKRAQNFGFAHGIGYFASVSLNIPLFDHGQAQRKRVEAQRSLAHARGDALSRSLTTELLSALIQYRAARAEFTRFDTRSSEQLSALLRAAQSGYREGERSILELLDAQRTQIEVEQRRLDLLETAKRAEARLRASAGDLQ